MKNKLQAILDAARHELMDGNSVMADKHIYEYWVQRRKGEKPPEHGDQEAHELTLLNKKNCGSCR